MRPTTVVLLLACLAGLGAVAAAGRPAEPPPPPSIPPVHTAGPAFIDAVAEVARAFVREDGPAVLAAIEPLRLGCRELQVEDEAKYGSEVVAYDKALHATVNKTIEQVLENDLDDGFNQFVWLQRTCRVCHAAARTHGVEIRFERSTSNRRD